MKIIGYHITPRGIYNSNGEHCSAPPYLDWLLAQSNPETIQVVYDIDYSTGCLLRLIGLTEEEGKRLWEKGRVTIKLPIEGSPQVEAYTITYYPGRSMMVDKGSYRGHPFFHLSNMSQYQEGRTGIDLTDRHLAVTAREIGEGMYQALTELGLHPKTLTSPVGAYRKEVMPSLDLPEPCDIPEGAMDYSYSCCLGPWVECYRKGHFDRTWDWDINSAFPYRISQLPDLGRKRGRWTREIDESLIPRRSLTYLLCRIDTEADFHPIMVKNQEGSNMTPTGAFEAIITGRMADFVVSHKLAKVEIVDGWQWIPTKPLRFPFREEMSRLYAEKQKANGLKAVAVKRLMVGVYGSLIQLLVREDRVGDFFIPPYGAEIETNTRLQVTGTCLEHGITPLHIAVDGFLTDSDLPIEGHGAMGEWKLAYQGSALVVGTGFVAVDGRKGDADFSLEYNWLLQELQSHPTDSEVVMSQPSPVTVGKAIQQGRWGDLGEIEEVTRSIDVGLCLSRWHEPEIQNCRDFLKTKTKSMPWDISLVGGLAIDKGD